MIDVNTESPWLTTADNVWNPFTNFEAWFAFDTVNQHNCNQVLAKFALTSDMLSEEENRQAVEDAIDKIIELDPEHLYCRVYAATFEEDLKKAKDLKEKIDSELINSVSD